MSYANDPHLRVPDCFNAVTEPDSYSAINVGLHLRVEVWPNFGKKSLLEITNREVSWLVEFIWSLRVKNDKHW